MGEALLSRGITPSDDSKSGGYQLKTLLIDTDFVFIMPNTNNQFVFVHLFDDGGADNTNTDRGG